MASAPPAKRIKVRPHESTGHRPFLYALPSDDKHYTVQDVAALLLQVVCPHQSKGRSIALEIDGYELLPHQDVQLLFRDGDTVDLRILEVAPPPAMHISAEESARCNTNTSNNGRRSIASSDKASSSGGPPSEAPVRAAHTSKRTAEDDYMTHAQRIVLLMKSELGVGRNEKAAAADESDQGSEDGEGDEAEWEEVEDFASAAAPSARMLLDDEFGNDLPPPPPAALFSSPYPTGGPAFPNAGGNHGGAQAALQVFEAQKRKREAHVPMQPSKRPKHAIPAALTLTERTFTSSSSSSSSASSSRSQSSSSSDEDSVDEDASGSDDSSSSSSSSSSSTSSASSSSSSPSEATESSDAAPVPQSSRNNVAPTSTRPLTPPGGWVPPGCGRPSTRSKNRKRRQRKRAEQRAANGESPSDVSGHNVSMSQSWVHDARPAEKLQNPPKQKAPSLTPSTGRSRAEQTLVLPPGGGSLGIDITSTPIRAAPVATPLSAPRTSAFAPSAASVPAMSSPIAQVQPTALEAIAARMLASHAMNVRAGRERGVGKRGGRARVNGAIKPWDEKEALAAARSALEEEEELAADGNTALVGIAEDNRPASSAPTQMRSIAPPRSSTPLQLSELRSDPTQPPSLRPASSLPKGMRVRAVECVGWYQDLLERGQNEADVGEAETVNAVAVHTSRYTTSVADETSMNHVNGTGNTRGKSRTTDQWDATGDDGASLVLDYGEPEATLSSSANAAPIVPAKSVGIEPDVELMRAIGRFPLGGSLQTNGSLTIPPYSLHVTKFSSALPGETHVIKALDLPEGRREPVLALCVYKVLELRETPHLSKPAPSYNVRKWIIDEETGRAILGDVEQCSESTTCESWRVTREA